MIYENPLHPPIPSNKLSSYSSLSGAVPFSVSLPPNRKWLPQGAYTPPKWKKPTGRGVTLPDITFDYANHAKGHGVSVSELVSRSGPALHAMLADATEQPLKDAGEDNAGKLTFKILWPGYSHCDWSRPVEVMTPEGPITRAQLAAVAARNLARFVETNRTAPCTEAEWSIASGDISISRLVLHSLVNVSGNVWQAAVIVES